MQRIILFVRQHGVELGGPGQAMGLVEMELREDIVSQRDAFPLITFSHHFTINSCLQVILGKDKSPGFIAILLFGFASDSLFVKLKQSIH